jgi:hypothetical protein
VEQLRVAVKMPGDYKTTTSARAGDHDSAPAGLSSYPNGASAERTALSGAQWATLEILQWTGLLRKYAYLIASVTIAVGLAVAISDKFFAVKWYRAQAVITPVPPDTSLASSIGLGTGGAVGASATASLLSLTGENDSLTIAQQYIAIMKSYAFTTALIAHYDLLPRLLRGRDSRAKPLSSWQQYRLVADRFETVWDYKSDDLQLYFSDPDREQARLILGYYLESLRDKVRSEEVRGAAAAAASLEDEIRKTSDVLLQNQLYELVARQIEREKLAQIQADFAFKVIEPPVVPDHYYEPAVRRDAALASALTFFLLCAVLMTFDFARRTRAQLEALERRRTASSAANHDRPPRRRRPASNAPPPPASAD